MSAGDRALTLYRSCVPANDEIDTQANPITPTYIIDGALRRVQPYYYVYEARCKRRWIGRELLEILNAEFHPRAPTQFDRLVDAGRITVNGERTTCDRRLKDNDLILNLTHRHEMAVLADEIQLLHVTDDLVVVDKPCSMPIHPCGRYRHNSVVYLLRNLHDITSLRLLYRLDRLTSGLVMFARNLKMAQKITRQIADREVTKVYLAKVDGGFPQDDEVVCSAPLQQLCPKMGIMIVDTNTASPDKPCRTVFKRRSYDNKTNTSVVECQPQTGRTHQIRVHLQHLGYPIVNDPLYNCDEWGEGRGKDGKYGKTKEELVEALWKRHNAMIVYLDDNATSFAGDGGAAVASEVNTSVDDSKDVDPMCMDCQIKFVDPTVDDLTMYLHCWRYSCADLWSYETKVPDWAQYPSVVEN